MLRGRGSRPLCRPRASRCCNLAVERGAVAGPLVGGGPVAGHLLRGKSLKHGARRGKGTLRRLLLRSSSPSHSSFWGVRRGTEPPVCDPCLTPTWYTNLGARGNPPEDAGGSGGGGGSSAVNHPLPVRQQAQRFRQVRQLSDVVCSPTSHNAKIATATTVSATGHRRTAAAAACSLRQPRTSGMPAIRRAAIWSARLRQSDAGSLTLSQRSESISSRRASRCSMGVLTCRASSTRARPRSRPAAQSPSCRRDAAARPPRARLARGRVDGIRRCLTERGQRVEPPPGRCSRAAISGSSRRLVNRPMVSSRPSARYNIPVHRQQLLIGVVSQLLRKVVAGETPRSRRPGAPPRRRKSPLRGAQAHWACVALVDYKQIYAI